MENQFQAIGMLIGDLRKGRNLLTEGIVEELRDNFREILMQLGYAWYQKVEWLDYLLDFHIAEAERLRTFVVHEEGRDYPSLRAVLYEELTLLITRLNMLVNGEEGLEWKELM
ncbi:MAG TPA: hypothetical protein VK541_11560 [Pedobacter sp.]|uniref:hypothetical protein n=1 Tax=Pedobacter sp. TaxID=1411316 RepID=UPI002D1CD3A0|nr:hypothetical protein [Pedobacter sp.]HMI03113.1 hypothetical protein [Pedobacter sp.]